jgi:hypothetical protein
MRITTILNSIFYRKRDKILPTNEEVRCNITESTIKNNKDEVSVCLSDVINCDDYILPFNTMKDTEEN